MGRKKETVACPVSQIVPTQEEMQHAKAVHAAANEKELRSRNAAFVNFCERHHCGWPKRWCRRH